MKREEIRLKNMGECCVRNAEVGDVDMNASPSNKAVD